jgi:SH3-like domain-containing protein
MTDSAMKKAIRNMIPLAMLTALPAQAAPPPAFIPHYVSQRVDKAYLREGPSYAHRILWIYRQRGYPFKVTASFDIWRRVAAPDGTTGWMSATMLTDKRSVLVTGRGRARLFDRAGGERLTGLADPGAIAGLKACTRDACRIIAKDIDGWIAKSRLWGVDADETFSR